MPHVAVILTARPSYARVKTVIAGLLANRGRVTVVACASALLERYGRVVDVLVGDFAYTETPLTVMECWTTLEGATRATTARETGLLLTELGGVLDRLKPDKAVVVADRHEVLAAAQAAAYLQIPLVHLLGGEHSGCIDDKVRDAVTHLADEHYVATPSARDRVVALTGDPAHVYMFGCPSVDLALAAAGADPVSDRELGGVGPAVALDRPFAVVLQHPVTDTAREADLEIEQTLLALEMCELPVVLLWPGQDAGAELMSKTIRQWQAALGVGFRAVRNLRPERFLRLLYQAAVLVGNSSVGVRESAAIGIPVVNIGTRQNGRLRAPNVVDVTHHPFEIAAAVKLALACGRYQPSMMYGTGRAGADIAAQIMK